jgi:hypothetical protein
MGIVVVVVVDIQVVAEDAEREDGYGETIAAISCVAAEDLGDGLFVVFYVLLTRSYNILPL